jgi:hypothetical protein
VDIALKKNEANNKHPLVVPEISKKPEPPSTTGTTPTKKGAISIKTTPPYCL